MKLSRRCLFKLNTFDRVRKVAALVETSFAPRRLYENREQSKKGNSRKEAATCSHLAVAGKRGANK